MNRLLAGPAIILASLSASAVMAADMPVKARPQAAGCGAQFNGFYLGGNVGAVAYTALRHDQDGLIRDNAEYSASRIGGSVGVQAGYDWQSCNKLFGVVTDWNWVDGGAQTRLDPNQVNANHSIAARLNWFGTFRGRAGLVVDNALFYVTGGLAVAGIDSTYSQQFGGNPLVRGSAGNTRYGFVGGVGTEVALGGNWSVSAEALYMQFEKRTDTFALPPGVGLVSFEANDQAYLARLGLNYRFGGSGSSFASAKASMNGKATVWNNGGANRFTGGYVGVNGASLSYTATRHDQDGYINDNAQYSGTKFGWSGGVQAGYDWQSGARLLGVVGDINYSGTTATARQNPNGFFGFGPADQTSSGKLNWYGTLRGRAGLVANDSLIYVTGGLAAADITTRIANIVPVFLQNEQFSQTATRWGWTAGAGVETALMGGWSLSSELLYMQFEKNSFSFNSPSQVRTVSFENNDSAWVSRIGLNYRGSAFASGGAPSAVPVRFAGLYLGANAGAIGYAARRLDQDGYMIDNAEYTASKTGATAGLQAGYDWQFGNKVFGVVGDINWTDTRTVTRLRPNDPAVDISTGGNINWFSTLRTRSGVAVDDVLVYLTGGLAVAGIDTTVTDASIFGNNERFSFRHTRWGWTGGAGAEFAFAKNWSVNAELLYMQFKAQGDTFVSPAQLGRPVSFESNDSAFVGRVGLNYRFNAMAVR